MSITVDTDVVLPDGGVIVDIKPLSREAAERMGEEIKRSLERVRLRFRAHSYVGLPRLPDACEACTDTIACRRINQCLRYKCEFGKVDKP